MNDGKVESDASGKGSNIRNNILVSWIDIPITSIRITGHKGGFSHPRILSIFVIGTLRKSAASYLDYLDEMRFIMDLEHISLYDGQDNGMKVPYKESRI